MRKVLLRAILALLPPATMVAQTAPLEFDVSSVKVSSEYPPGGYSHKITPGGITIARSSMGYCIRLAYGVSSARPYELVGPAWLNPPTDVLIDITAKTAAPATPEEVTLMLRRLLEERFGLKVHREVRELPVYELHRMNRGLVLAPSATGGEAKAKSAGLYVTQYEHVSMEQLTTVMGPPWTSRPVLDKTGLTGTYDFKLDLSRYVIDPATGTPITDPLGRVDTEVAIPRALRDQLGLTLTPGRAPISVLVVDRVEKRPTEK